MYQNLFILIEYLKELGVTLNIEAYIQSRVLKKTLESVSFEHRRGILDGAEVEDKVEKAIERLENAGVGMILA